MRSSQVVFAVAAILVGALLAGAVVMFFVSGWYGSWSQTDVASVRAGPLEPPPFYNPSDHHGVVAGVVRLRGPAPVPRITEVSGPCCAAARAAAGRVYPRCEVGPGGGLPHTFVWATAGPYEDLVFGATDSPTQGRVVLRSKDGAFEPHVFGVMQGEFLTIRHDDPDGVHNIHVKPLRNAEANISQQPGDSDHVTFDKREKAFPIVDDVHSWMECWVHVRDHPFFATTDADGRFEITGLPAGRYEFAAWHELHGETRFEVLVSDAVPVSVEVPLGKDE